MWELKLYAPEALGGYTWDGKADVSLGAVGAPEVDKAVLGR